MDWGESKITAVAIPQEEWVKGNYGPVGCLRYSTAELEKRLGVLFLDEVIDGLGEIKVCDFRLPNGRLFSLVQYLKGAPINPSVEIVCRKDEHFLTDLEDVLEALDMDLSDLARTSKSVLAVLPEVSFTPHALYRQDDNGFRTLIEVLPSRADASKRMRDLEARGHKQAYWIEAQQADAGAAR